MNYIIIYLEIEHLLNFLTQEEKGDFLDLLIAYGKNQEYPKTENKKLLNVFNFMKGRLDTQFEKARIKAEIAKKNGANGGRPPKDKKPSKNPSQPKKTQSVNPTLQEVKDYCLERKNSVNPEKWINHYEANGWKVGKNSMKNWKACIRTWENSDYNNLAPKNDLLTKLNLIAGFDAFKSIEEGEESVSLYAIDTLKVSALADETKDKIKAQFINKKIILR
jgi:hypothetical protein